MPRPSAISLVPSAINPPPISLERPLLLLEAAIAASAPGIWSIKAWTLSEGPSLRRKPRTMPMVFSATALSMPALEASRPISSSIYCPVPNRLNRVAYFCLDLERLRSEIQAISVHQGGFASQVLQQCKSECRNHTGLLRCVLDFF